MNTTYEKIDFWNSTYQIPNRESVWIDTDPKGFNSLLTTNNNKYNSILKPITKSKVLAQALAIL